MNVRELVLDMLLQMEAEGTYSNRLVRDVLDKYDYLEGKEKAFLKRLSEGTVERQIQIDYILNYYSKVPVRKMKPLIRCVLRMGVYQILFMDGVLDAAACNEAVKLAAKRKFGQLKGFVNGVLRSIAREKGNIEEIYPDKKKEPLQYLSVVYSMPEHLVSMWLEDYGRKQTEKMLQAMLEVHPVTIRLRQDLDGWEVGKETAKREGDGKRKTGGEAREWLLDRMREAGVQVRRHPYLNYAYCLTHLEGVKNLPGFREGLFTVQDVSSMLAVECAGIKAGDFVLDVCAAPGGKGTHAAELLKGTGKALCRDISEEKAALIRENAERLGLTNIEVEVHDARVYDAALCAKADVVLADLPCSGLGVLGKKRDIKYHVTQESMEELQNLQKELLDVVWRYVKPAGTLLYTTCTIHKEENEEMARWFLENHPFRMAELSPFLKKAPEIGMTGDGFLQLLPGVHETDGFFIAKFIREDV